MRLIAGSSSIRQVAAGLCVAMAAATCGGSPAPLPRSPRPKPSPSHQDATGQELRGPAGLPARLLVSLDAETEQAFVARRADGGLLLTRRDGHWQTYSFEEPAAKTARGSAASGPVGPGEWHDLGAAPEGEPRAAVAALDDGYLFAWAEPEGEHRELKAVALDPTGAARGTARIVARVVEPVAWLQVLSGKSGALLLWEVVRDGSRDLWVTPWPKGKTATRPTAIARDVLAWHAVATPEGAALVSVAGASRDAGTPTGRVELREIAADGTVTPAAIVSEPATAQLDAQLVALGNRYLVAWTDARPLLLGRAEAELSDPHVYVATVERGTRQVRGPHLAVPPVGAQALVALAAHPAARQALLAWEPQVPRRATERRIYLQTLTADGQPTGRRAEIGFATTGDAPHFAASPSGFLTLTLAPPALAQGQTPETLARDYDVVPTYVRFDAELEVIASEPVRVAALGDPGIPHQVRALRCELERCSALVGGDQPPRLALVQLPPRKSSWQPAAATLPLESPPVARRLGTVGMASEPLAGNAAVRLSDGRTLLAWITHAPAPASRKRGRKSTEATLAYRLLDRDGKPGPRRELSRRAISLGGVSAVAVGDSTTKDKTKGRAAAVLAWVAPNNGDPQIFVTEIGPDGSKLGQRAVTQVRRNRQATPGFDNEVFDVDIAADGRGGYLLAWTDTRDGNAEIYAARLDERLNKKGQDQRITHAPGSSTEVSLAAGTDLAWLIWSDARERVDEGVADVYLALLDNESLKKMGDEQRLARTPAHSRTPGVALTSSGALAWWIEQPTVVGTSVGATGRVLQLDQAGQPRGSSAQIAPPGRQVTSVVADCAGRGCRGACASVRDGVLRIDSFALPAGTSAKAAAPITTKPIALVGTGTAQDIELTASGRDLRSLFFVGTAAGGGGRVRQLRLDW